MSNYTREEILRNAAERLRRQKEREKREENEFYDRITSGKQWFFFKIVVVFCTLMMVLTTIEVFVDGPTKKLTENDWKIDQNWEYTWHKVLDVQGYMFTPTLGDWIGHVDNSFKITYSPIFRTGKKLSYNQKIGETNTYIERETIRERSIFNWFPYLQIALLIPLFTFIFKTQKPWFNFARVGSMAIILPGILMILFFTLL